MSSPKYKQRMVVFGQVRPEVGGSRTQSRLAGPIHKHHALSLALAIAGTLGCASSAKQQPNLAGPAEELPAAEVYFPLRDGHIYQYSVVGQDGRSGLLINKISRNDDSASLTSGELVQQLTVRGDGIYNESGYYVVKLPMVVGAEWSGRSGLVKVVAVGQRVETGAGKFVDCVLTREVTQGTVEVRSVETTFCPNVGLVRLQARAEGSAAVSVEEATLQYFGPPIDVNAL